MPFPLIQGAFTLRVGKIVLWSVLLALVGESLRYGVGAHLLGNAFSTAPRWSAALAVGLALAVVWLLAKSFKRAVAGLTVAGLICLSVEGVRYVYVWGHEWPTAFHWGYALLVGWFLAVADLVVVWLATIFPKPGIRLISLSRLLGWLSFRTTFKKARWSINTLYIAVALIYCLYYLTEELQTADPESRLYHIANWLNAHVFSFPMLGRNLQATDIIPLEIVGYLLYGIAELLYKISCPRMLSTAEAGNGTPPGVFARTLRKDGARIPAWDLARTMDELVESYNGSLSKEAADRVHHSLQELRRAGNQSRNVPTPAAAAAAADVAKELPDASAGDLGEIGEDLFNTLYPRTRVAIYALVFVSAVLGLVPVIGKALLVLAPRLARPLS